MNDLQVAILALSFDQRFEKYHWLWDAVVSIIRECEQQGQFYQIICTGVTNSELYDGWYRLIEHEGIYPQHLMPVEMDMIDIGGAAQNTEKWIEQTALTQCLYCNGKGFYRPSYLHVNPDGGVRSCLYATGAGWLGNINEEPLQQIESEFYDNSIVTAFSIEYFS